MIEVEARARPERETNPVDLGAVLMPHDWLLLEGGEAALVSAAALSHSDSFPNARIRAWFDNGASTELPMPVGTSRIVKSQLRVPLTAKEAPEVLHIRLMDGTRSLWRKDIRTMVVNGRPDWPTFGAVETELRYEASIPVTDPTTGSKSALSYDRGWSPTLKDVVVNLPNGSRFVFWRGSSYAPFWASHHNSGICYQFAEDTTRPTRHRDGTIDFPEPLNDKELRFGRVQIIESTSSRVHGRMSCLE